MIETLSPLTEVALTALHLFGLPALFVVFVLKGALIGKVFPTSVFLPGYVIATGATIADATIVITVVTVAHVVGQAAIFVGSRRYGTGVLRTIPMRSLDTDGGIVDRVDAWFDRHGDLAVFGSNVFPWSRGVIAVPAGASAYPTGRYLGLMTAATVLYHGAYVGIGLIGVRIVAGAV